MMKILNLDQMKIKKKFNIQIFQIFQEMNMCRIQILMIKIKKMNMHPIQILMIQKIRLDNQMTHEIIFADSSLALSNV